MKQLPLPNLRTLAGLAAVALAAGCAAPDIRSIEQATLAGVKPCCTSLQGLPAPAPIAAENEVVFSAATPHFDLGRGLAPVVSYRLTPGVRFLSLMAKAQAPQPFFFADLHLVFLDTAGQRLPEPVLSTPLVRTYGAMGTYMLVRYAAVPAGAATVLMGTGSKNAGQGAQTQGRIPGGGLMVGGVFLPLAGAEREFPYFHAIYGGATLLALENPPKP